MARRAANRILFTLFFFGLATMAAASAHAAVMGYAEINNFQIQLVDLDLADGISPSLTFLDAPYTGGPASVYSRIGAPLYEGDAINGPLYTAMQHVNDGGNAYAISTLTPTLLGVTATAFARADGDTTAHANTAAVYSLNFRLSPMTMLVLTADSAAAWIASTLADEQTNVGARLLINVGAQTVVTGALPGWGSGTASNLQVSYSNLADTDVGGYVDAVAYAWVQGVPTPVPEPGSAGLTAAALAVLMQIARRRKEVADAV